MVMFILGLVAGTMLTAGFWAINRWYWKSMYQVEVDYSNKLKRLFGVE